MSEKTYTIKQVAELVNESDHTIRFYCKEGLFPFAKRDRNNVRRFTESDLEGVEIVLCLRDTGMPLADVRHYMELCTQGASTLEERLQIIRNQEIRAREELEAYKQKIAHLEEKESYYVQAIEDQNGEDKCNPLMNVEMNKSTGEVVEMH